MRASTLDELYTMISLPQINQVYVMFRARLLDLDFGPGTESLEVRLFAEDDIPWEQLAFRTITRTLRNFFLDRARRRVPAAPVELERRAADCRPGRRRLARSAASRRRRGARTIAA